MTELALVGDIGGTNSRFGLVEPGSTVIRDIEALKNNNFGSLEAAVGNAARMAAEARLAAGDAGSGPIGRIATVLLSPAAASFDMFADYAARGRAFKRAVAALGAGGTAGSGHPTREGSD